MGDWIAQEIFWISAGGRPAVGRVRILMSLGSDICLLNSEVGGFDWQQGAGTTRKFEIPLGSTYIDRPETRQSFRPVYLQTSAATTFRFFSFWLSALNIAGDGLVVSSFARSSLHRQDTVQRENVSWLGQACRSRPCS